MPWSLVSILVGVLYSQEAMVLGFPLYMSLVSVYYYTGVSLGVIITFLPLHFLGYNIQPRRVPDNPDSYQGWGSLSSLGSGVTVLSMLVMPDTPLGTPRVDILIGMDHTVTGRAGDRRE